MGKGPGLSLKKGKDLSRKKHCTKKKPRPLIRQHKGYAVHSRSTQKRR